MTIDLQKKAPETRKLKLSHAFYNDAEIDAQQAEKLKVLHYTLPKSQYKWREWQSQLAQDFAHSPHAYLMRSHEGNFGLFVALADDSEKYPIIFDADKREITPVEVRYNPILNPVWIRLLFRKSITETVKCKNSHTLGRPLLKVDQWSHSITKQSGIHALALDCRTQQLKGGETTEIALFYENIPLREVMDKTTLCAKDVYWTYNDNGYLMRFSPASKQETATSLIYKEIPKKNNKQKNRPFLDLASATHLSQSWPYLLGKVQDAFIKLAQNYGFKVEAKYLNLVKYPHSTRHRSGSSGKKIISSIPDNNKIHLLDCRYNQSVPFTAIKQLIEELLLEKKIRTKIEIIANITENDADIAVLNTPILTILDQRAHIEHDLYARTDFLKKQVALQHMNINPYDLQDNQGANDLFEEVTLEEKTVLRPPEFYYQYTLDPFYEKDDKNNKVRDSLQRNLEICLKELMIKQLLLDTSTSISAQLPLEASLLTEDLLLITEGYLFTVKDDRPILIPVQINDPPLTLYLNQYLAPFNITMDQLLHQILHQWPYQYRKEYVFSGFGSYDEKLQDFMRRTTLILHKDAREIHIMMQDPKYDRPHILFDEIEEIFEILRKQQHAMTPDLWYINQKQQAECPKILETLILTQEIPAKTGENMQMLLPYFIEAWNAQCLELQAARMHAVTFQLLKKNTYQGVIEATKDRPFALSKRNSYISKSWSLLCSQLFNINLKDIRSQWLNNVPGISHIWHDPEQNYYLVGSLTSAKVKIERQPSIRQWHSLQGNLDTNLLTALVDVDWVRVNQLAGNPCPALIIRRWREMQSREEEFKAICGAIA